MLQGLGRREACLCFLWARTLCSDEIRSSEKMRSITFVDFLEALARVAEVIWCVAHPCADIQRCEKVANRNVWHGATGIWSLNEGQTPHFSVVRVHVSTGYNRGKSAGVAKRPRERSPARNP
jgi:hypothetical protein